MQWYLQITTSAKHFRRLKLSKAVKSVQDAFGHALIFLMQDHIQYIKYNYRGERGEI
jgi:hypothetical protein